MKKYENSNVFIIQTGYKNNNNWTINDVLLKHYFLLIVVKIRC